MDEQSLIQQAQAGDTGCFSQLVRMHQKRLYQYLLARCQNSYDADDVMQDTFISAYKYLNSYKNKWQFSTWLFTIANRLIKKQQGLYNQNVTLDANLELKGQIKMDDTNFWALIRTLVKSNAYDVLWFFYIEGLSIKDIAQIVQRSQSWVKISMYRSKKRLLHSQKIKNISKDYLMQGIIV